MGKSACFYFLLYNTDTIVADATPVEKCREIASATTKHFDVIVCTVTFSQNDTLLSIKGRSAE